MPSFQGVGIEEFHCIQRCPHFRVLEQRGSTVYRGVLISGCWNRGVPLYTEVSSCQSIGIGVLTMHGHYLVRMIPDRARYASIVNGPLAPILSVNWYTYKQISNTGCKKWMVKQAVIWSDYSKTRK